MTAKKKTTKPSTRVRGSKGSRARLAKTVASGSRKSHSPNQKTQRVGDRAKGSSRRVSRSTGSGTEPEAKTMDELLAKFGKSPRSMVRGDKLEGVVVDILPKRLIVDIGAKGQGLVAEKAYDEAKKFIKTLKVGDKISAHVIVAETPEGYTILSLRHTSQDASWKKLETAQKASSKIRARVKGVNASGATVDIDGLTGFVPNSFMGKNVLAKSQELVGDSIEVVILELDREKNKIVVSEKHVSEKDTMELTGKAVKKLKSGDTYKGIVVNVADFGCFVQIKVDVNKKKVPLEGLVHISEIAWNKTTKASDVVSEGDEVKVKILEVGGERPGKRSASVRLALSIKQAQDDPWDKAEKKYTKDSKHKGVVVRVSDFGSFVELEPGIEGLVHMTKIPPDTKMEVGKKVNVLIEEIDVAKRKLSLGLVLTKIPVGYK